MYWASDKLFWIPFYILIVFIIIKEFKKKSVYVLLNGAFTIFHITTATIHKTIFFDRIYFHSSENNCETNLKAQNILNILDKKLNFKWRLESIEKYLSKGKYSIWLK